MLNVRSLPCPPSLCIHTQYIRCPKCKPYPTCQACMSLSKRYCVLTNDGKVGVVGREVGSASSCTFGLTTIWVIVGTSMRSRVENCMFAALTLPRLGPIQVRIDCPLATALSVRGGKHQPSILDAMAFLLVCSLHPSQRLTGRIGPRAKASGPPVSGPSGGWIVLCNTDCQMCGRGTRPSRVRSGQAREEIV